MLRSELAPLLSEYADGMPEVYAFKVKYRPWVGPIHIVLGNVSQGARLLDIGCGTGSFLYLALKMQEAYLGHGYDISEGAIAAGNSFSNIPQNFEIRHKPSPWPPENLHDYDTVTMIDVLHHIPASSQDQFLTTLAQSLSPGSKLIIADIEGRNVISNISAKLWDLVGNKCWVNPRKSKEIASIFEANNLKVLSVQYAWSFVFKHFICIAEKA